MKRTYTVIDDQKEYHVEIDNSEEKFELKLGNNTHHFKILYHSETLYSFLIDDTEVLEADLKFNQDKCDLYLRNIPFHLEVYDPKRRNISQSEMSTGNGIVVAPMPGKIIEVKVTPGQEVKKAQPLLVIEAMKMQNELFAPVDGVVQEVTVRAGDAAQAEQMLVRITRA